HTPAHMHTQAAQPPQPPASTVHTLKHPLPSKPAALSLDVPVRLVVCFGGNPPQDLRSGPQTELFW
ncbi:hypothetical protein FRC11_014751, partial [Ceratobasidium sp. 423]